MYGSMRELTEEELARAIRLDPSQIAGLGPSIDALLMMLLERKRKILAKYETSTVQKLARREYRKLASKVHPPDKLREAFDKAVRDEQIREAILSLPSKYRIVVVLRYFEGYSCEQIAQILECPAATVRTRLFRAHARLAQKLQQYFQILPAKGDEACEV